MMKKRIRFAAFLLALLQIIVLCASCRSELPEETESAREDTGEISPPLTSLQIKKDGASPYVIVCDMKNDADVAIARMVSHLFLTYYGVELTVAHMNKRLPYEILIGNVESREESRALAANFSSDADFGIAISGSTLSICYQKSEAVNLLLIKLKELLKASDTTSGVFSIPDNGTYLFMQDPDRHGLEGSTAVLAENGKSDFAIVCHADDKASIQVAEALQDAIEERLGIRLDVTSDRSKNKHEIVVSAQADRPWINGYAQMLNAEESDFLIAVDSGNIALLATDRTGYSLAVLKLCEDYLREDASHTVTLRESENYYHGVLLRDYAYNEAAYCALYRSIFDTFETEYEQCVANLVPIADRMDQVLVKALIQRMHGAAAFKIGDSTALFDGFCVKLDPLDYEKTASVDASGEVWIPTAFARSYFGSGVNGNAEGFFNLSAHCRTVGGYSLFTCEEAPEILLLLPHTVPSISPLHQKVGGYTNLQYVTRIARFFEERYEPSNSTEQSRVVIAHSEYPQHVADCDTVNYYTHFSPSILVSEKNGSEVIYASHELAYLEGYDRILEAVTVIFSSTDGGMTWAEIGRVNNVRDAELFELNGAIYLMGQNLKANNSPMLAMQKEDGTWRYVGSLTKGEYIGSTAPTSILIANGRIYRAHDKCVISAATDSDLFLAASWTKSNEYADVLDASWLSGALGKSFDTLTLYEGNIILGQDGRIYNLMRINEVSGYIAIVEVSADGTAVSAVAACNSLVSLPTTPSKFSVLYDDVSGYYLTLVSYDTGVRKADRTTLCLCVSKDLIQWSFVDFILVEREMMNAYCASFAHAYQYVDFDLRGEDLMLIVREASGRTNFCHDGNYTTVYTVSDFRGLINGNIS